MKLLFLSLLLCTTFARAANYIGDQTFSSPFKTSEAVNVVGDLTLSVPGAYTAGSWNVVGTVRFAQPGDYYFVATQGGIAASGSLGGPLNGRATIYVNYRTSANFVGVADSNLRLIDESQTAPLPPPEVVTPPPAAPLMNLSTRVTLAAGGSITVGFVVGGESSRRVLVRAIGPGLAAFGVNGALTDPKFAVVGGSIEVTPDKKIVWALRDWDNFYWVTTMQTLDDPRIREKLHFGSTR